MEEHLAPVADPSLTVRYRKGAGRELRVHPGAYDDPLRAIDAVEMLFPLDDLAVKAFGYGFTDLVDIATVSMDRQLRELSPFWDHPSSGSADAPVEISPAEVRAAGGLIHAGHADLSSPLVWLADCRSPERAATALAAMVEASADRVAASFVISLGGRRVIAPAGFMIPILASTTTLHLGHLRNTNEVDRRLTHMVRLELARWLLVQPVPIKCADPYGEPFVAVVGARHAICFEPERAGDPCPRDEAIPHVVVTPLQEAPYQRTNPPRIAVTELVRLGRKAPLRDLYGFFEALTIQDPLPLAQSVVDLYNLWLLVGTLDPTVAGRVAPVVVDDEWRRAAMWDSVDAVLDLWSLPPSRRWATREVVDHVDIEATLARGTERLLLRIEPRFGVVVEAAPKCPEPSLALALADSFRLRAKEPGLRDLVERVGGERGLLLRIDVAPDAVPAHERLGEVFIEAAVAAPGAP